MVWKSREDKAPPPQFFADVIGYLHHAFPGAALTREALEALAPHLVQEWRNGQSARNAAKATCSCDGRVITVSPAAQVQLGKRSVLPPVGASRGTLFGIESLRERREIAALRVKAAVEARHLEYHERRVAELQAEHSRLLSEGKQAKAAKLAETLGVAAAAVNRHHAQRAQLLQEADQLARARGLWIPPAAQGSAITQATQKRVSTPNTAAPASKKRVAKATSEKTEPRKKKCTQCTEKPPLEADLSALVDEFVDAAMKDEGK
jgi:hypothetical protein